MTLADIKNEGIDRDPRAAFTYPGQASWAIPGSSFSCRECMAWGFANVPVEYYATTGMLKPRECTAAVLPLPKPQVPHYARACRHFAKNPNAPPLERVRKPKERSDERKE